MDKIEVSSDTLKEALSLSETILQEIELSSTTLTTIALKASRLARLIGDYDHQQIFAYEASGYPGKAKGIPQDVWRYLELAGRVYETEVDGVIKEHGKTASIEELENRILACKESLSVATDAPISISSANPNQWVKSPEGNAQERRGLRNTIGELSQLVANRRAFIHSYVSSVYYNLKYSSIQSDIFSRVRDRVDSKIGYLVPDAVKKFIAVYENLRSDNSEDWSNAVHSCRRILQDTADSLYPPHEGKEGKKLGKDNYINRLIAYIEDNSSSSRFQELVGSNLKYIGERLDAVFKASQKGSHSMISSQEEADRYTIYTYLIVGDILQLREDLSLQQETIPKGETQN